MKRVLWTGSYGKDCVPEINKWLMLHPGVELLDVKPIVDGKKTEVFCIVEIPESANVKNWPKREQENMGLMRMEEAQ